MTEIDGTWSDEAEFTALDARVDAEAADAEAGLSQPVLAVVGRPNVGKSTLVNRILGRREAVVQDVPGVTRDRVAYDAMWSGRRFTIVDTGGWEPGATGLQGAVAAQAELAMSTSDAVLLVVDASVGATATDEAVSKVLRRSKRPVLLAANKVDDHRLLGDVASLWSLGLGEPFAVSALHGRSSGDLLDAIIKALPEAPRDGERAAGPRRVALVGKPNVGKSSLLNKLTGEERAVVDSVAGTTVDPVDSLVELDGQPWRFVDTAGLRKRVHTASGAEYYASLRTKAAIDAAEVAIVLLDASEPISEQDLRVLTMVVESGRACVLALNKWDLVDEDRRHQLDRELERGLVRVPWAARCASSRPRCGPRSGRGTPGCRPGSSMAGFPTSSRRPRRRCAAASSRRCCSRPRPRSARRPWCCSPQVSWRPATAASSSASSASASVSPAAPSASTSASARRIPAPARSPAEVPWGHPAPRPWRDLEFTFG